MRRNLQPAVTLFGIGMIEVGALAAARPSFTADWLPLPAWLPLRVELAYVAAAVMLVCGAGLLAERTRMWAVRILFPFVIVWQLLGIPDFVQHLAAEMNWLSFGEVAPLLAAGLLLFDRFGAMDVPGWLEGERAVRLAQLWLGFWLIPIGLSHFFYPVVTQTFVPAWMPWQGFWGPFVGVAHIAAGLGVLAGVRFGGLGRIAAGCWAAMLGLFVLLVWVPRISTALPAPRWLEVVMTWTMAAGAYVVAQACAGQDAKAKGGAR